MGMGCKKKGNILLFTLIERMCDGEVDSGERSKPRHIAIECPRQQMSENAHSKQLVMTLEVNYAFGHIE